MLQKLILQDLFSKQDLTFHRPTLYSCKQSCQGYRYDLDLAQGRIELSYSTHYPPAMALAMIVVLHEPATCHRGALTGEAGSGSNCAPSGHIASRGFSHLGSEDLSPSAIAGSLNYQRSATSLLCVHACVPSYGYKYEMCMQCSGILWHVSWHFLPSACQSLTV